MAQHTDTAPTEQRAGENSINNPADNSRDATGTANVDPVAGTTVNRPGDPAHGNTYGSDASGSAAGHDAVVTGTPQGGQVLERAGESTERGADAAGNAGERAAQGLENAGNRAENATERGLDTAGDAISDAAITASVNAELARDDELSAIGINVDTDSGRVTLSGTAPNQAAVQRATQLAKQVRGVKDVRNALRVEAR